MLKPIFLTAVLLVLAGATQAQTPDPQILAEIQQIKAIDNHSHPPKLVSPGEKDDDYDALPCDPLEPSVPTTTSRPENPQYVEAWKALYNYPYNDAAPEHVKELLQARSKVMQQQGNNFPDWVLDQLGIETELANRVAMGRGLQPPHFRWVPFDDALMYPLKNSGLQTESPDRRFFFSRETNLLRRYMQQITVDALPHTLEEYTAKVITPTLALQKKNGAVAIKFEAAYLRSLDFGRVPPSESADLAEARSVYARFIKGGIAQRAEYAELQNYLFRYIAREAGRLGLPVHIHTGGGCGTYFDLAGSNPVLLDSVFNDPSLRKTKFVMLHGGAGPFTKYVAYLLMKPNVYTDFSEQTWLIPTRALSKVIRQFLEWYPEKVMFGTDLYPNTPEIDWDVIGWQTTHSAREALAIALTGMMEDHEITRVRALQLAHMVLHDNAAKLYGWTR